MGYAARANKTPGIKPHSYNYRRVVGRPLNMGTGTLSRYVDDGVSIRRAVPKVRGKSARRADKKARVLARLAQAA